MKLPVLVLSGFMLLTSSAYAARQELDRIIAVVNNDVILQSTLDEAIVNVERNARRNNQRLPASRTQMRDQILEDLIIRAVQLQRAERIGVNVDNNTLNQQIERMASDNGMSVATFRRQLLRDGIEYNRFRDEVREEIVINELRNREVLRNVNISEQDIDDLIARDNKAAGIQTEYLLEHLVFSVPEGASRGEKAKIREAAEATRQRWRTGTSLTQLSDPNVDNGAAELGWRQKDQLPRLFTDALKTLETGQLSPILSSDNGYHLLLLKAKKDNKSRSIEQLRARHILVSGKNRSKEEIESRLRQIYQALQGGAEFGVLAGQYSEDPGSAGNGGELPWFGPGDMVPTFEQGAAALQPGEVSQPVRSPFGWHVIQLLDRRVQEADDKNLRARARAALTEQRGAEQTQLWLRRLRDEAFVDLK